MAKAKPRLAPVDPYRWATSLRLGELDKIRLAEMSESLPDTPQFRVLNETSLAALAVQIAVAVVRAGRVAEFVPPPTWQTRTEYTEA